MKTRLDKLLMERGLAETRSKALGLIMSGSVAVNGRPVPTLSAFVAELDRVGIGNLAELTVIRGERELKLRVKVVDVVP